MVLWLNMSHRRNNQMAFMNQVLSMTVSQNATFHEESIIETKSQTKSKFPFVTL